MTNIEKLRECFPNTIFIYRKEDDKTTALMCSDEWLESEYKAPDGKNAYIKALEQEAILDKIRTEIETKYGQCDICEYFEDYDYEENDISEYRPIGNIADILQIIDKYKAESEG